MLFECENCGLIFDEEQVRPVFETHGMDSPPFETEYGCPSCGATSIAFASKCLVCGNEYAESDLICEICEDCLHDKVAEYCLLYTMEVDGFLDFFVTLFRAVDKEIIINAMTDYIFEKTDRRNGFAIFVQSKIIGKGVK